MKRSPLYLFLCLGMLGAGASLLIFWIMANGPGISPDSAVYIETAKSILSGNGFCIQGNPITHWPPGYSFILAGAALLNHNIAASGRYLHALIFGINVILVGLAIYVSGERRLILIVCAVLIFLFAPTTLLVHSMAWSEAPFVTFSLVSFLLLSFYFDRPVFPVLLASGLALGLAITIRYVGVTLLFPAIAALMLFGKRSSRQRIGGALVFILIAGAPLAYWLSRNLLVAGNATNRSFAWHPVSLEQVKTVIMNMSIFVIPISIPLGMPIRFIVDILLFIVVCASLIITYRNQINDKSYPRAALVLPFLSVIFSVVYLLFIFISICCFDASTPLDDRILYPAFVFLLIAVFAYSGPVGQFFQKPAIARGIIVLIVIIAFYNCILGGLAALRIRKGLHYTLPEYGYYNSETVALVKKLPWTTRIYSNCPNAITFLADKEAFSLPYKVHPSTHLVNEQYQEEIARVCRQCRENKALVVYLNVRKKRDLPIQKELPDICKLRVWYVPADGIIYGGQEEIGSNVDEASRPAAR